jgi:hypothetical protein
MDSCLAGNNPSQLFKSVPYILIPQDRKTNNFDSPEYNLVVIHQHDEPLRRAKIDSLTAVVIESAVSLISR